MERAPAAGTAAQRPTPKYGNAELMETGDGELLLYSDDGEKSDIRADVSICLAQPAAFSRVFINVYCIYTRWDFFLFFGACVWGNRKA